jgi:hypothetical protein
MLLRWQEREKCHFNRWSSRCVDGRAGVCLSCPVLWMLRCVVSCLVFVDVQKKKAKGRVSSTYLWAKDSYRPVQAVQADKQ